MTTFALGRKYQFGIFVAPGTPVDAPRVAELLARQPASAPALTVRFNKMVQTQAFTPLADGQLVPVPVFSFTGPPVWRLDVSGFRIDINVDAHGYEEVADKPLPLETACSRVVSNLAELTSTMAPFGATRLVLFVQLQGAVAEATQRVAEEYFSDSVQEGARSSDILELNARKNTRATWTVGGAATQINRIEMAESLMQLPPAPDPFLLNWTFDVNTAPSENRIFSGNAVLEFFDQAVRWTNGRLREIESH